MKNKKLILKNGLTETEKRKRILLTIMLGVLLSLLYIVIFSLSAQNAEDSGELSMKFTEKCVENISGLSGIADKLEKPVRKLAHFGEYALMGVLVCLLLGLWYERNRWLFLSIIGWVSVSAVFDEIHQLFVPGRYSSVLDVLLDTAGGMTGVLVLVLFLKIYRVTFCRKNL